MTRAALLLCGLLWPAAAMADPISALAFLAPIIGGTAGAFVVSYAGYIAYSWNRQRRAKQAARDAYNASLRDRAQMVDLLPDAARTICLGRVRTVEGIRRRWTSGVNSDQLTLIISFAGHEIDGYTAFFFNDQQLSLDGSGYVQNAPYLRAAPESKSMTVTLDGSGGKVQVLASVPISGSVRALVGNGGTGIDYEETALSVSVAGSTVTISGGTAGATCSILWQTTVGQSFARIRTYNGTATQNVGADLDAEYPGKITATDEFAGIALAVVDLFYDPDIFPQGIPNVSARIRGAKVYDPRADSTQPGGSGSQRLATPSTWVWSENSALHAYHYARHANGWAVPAAEIRMADVMAAADACDVSTDFTLRAADDSTSTVTMPRYRCGIVIPTDADPQAMMAEIMESMAGRHGWAGGTWRMRAGMMKTPVWDLQPSWVAQRMSPDGAADTAAFVRISNGVERNAKVNRVFGVCVDRDQRFQVLPFPAIEDPVLIAAEGEYAVEVEMQGVNHQAHAQHLGSIMIRESQAALRMELLCNISAFRLELLDVGTVTLPRFGMTDKPFEVIGWQWHPSEGVRLGLAEITDEIFEPLDELTGRDPAPDSSLPPPWDVETVTGVAVTSGTTALTDGAIITRTRVVWDAVTSQAIRRGGKIEVQYTPAADTLPAGDWPSWVEEGDSTEAVIPGLLRRNYVFRVRAINSLRVRGAWSAQVMHYVSQTRAPKVFRQTTAPSGGVSIEGDRWFDTDDDNHPYVRASGVWISVRDGTIQDAQATADGKVVTFVQSSAPDADGVGDLWLDSDDGNKLYRWNGSAWVALPLGTGGLAANSATEVYVSTPGSPVTVTEESTSPDAYARNTELTSITFTPGADGTASIFAEGQGEYTTAGSSADCQYSVQLFGGAYDDWKERYESTPASSTRTFPMSTTRRVAVTGGVSYKFGFIAAKLNTADTFVVENIEMRIEVIKR
jgi:hypothetical protein